MPTKSSPKPSLLNQTLNYLKYRSRSSQEISRYLSQKTRDQKAIDQTLQQLTDLNLINDADFALQYIHSKIRQSYGPVVIRFQLKSRYGLDQTTIISALDQVNFQDWLNAALKYLQKIRSKLAAQASFHARRAAYQHLYRRGFPQDIINAAIDEFNLTE